MRCYSKVTPKPIFTYACFLVTFRWSQKNPEGRAELIEIFKAAGREEGLVGLKTIAILKGEFFMRH